MKTITIHPAEDITGRYWVFIDEDGKELNSYHRANFEGKNGYTLEEAKEKCQKLFGEINIEISGIKINA